MEKEEQIEVERAFANIQTKETCFRCGATLSGQTFTLSYPTRAHRFCSVQCTFHWNRYSGPQGEPCRLFFDR